jgi:tetrahydromethanopterin S-methyltransferase subunit F
MIHQELDPLADHLRILEDTDPLSLDPDFYDRFRDRMLRHTQKQERSALRHAGLATGILALLFILNLVWLGRNAGTDSSVEVNGISGFASFYSQSISSDL